MPTQTAAENPMNRNARWPRVALGAVVLLGGLPAAGAAPATATGKHWWSDYTTMATEPQGKNLAAIGADCYRPFCHGGWYGWWYINFTEQGGWPASQRKLIEGVGAKPVAYYDVGEVGDFIVLVGDDNKLIVHGWNWHTWAGQPGKVRWFGLQSFMEDPKWAPYPSANAYGLPPFTTAAGDPIPPGGLYEAVGRRWLDGKVHFMEGANGAVTDKMAAATGLAAVSEPKKSHPDVVGGTGWKTSRLTSLDRANPQLRDYHGREFAAFIKHFRPAGVHIDNLGDTDALIPPMQSFGDWSSRTFRDFLRRKLTRRELEAHGITDVDTFEIRDYVQQGYVSGSRLNGPHLRDSRWLDDKIWKAYLVHKAETGLAYGRHVYQAAKQAAAEEGLDCGIFGNIIPMFPGAELTRDFCDVVHFEWLSQGKYGPLPELGFPPVARSAYVVRLGRAISQPGYCWPSLYVPKRLSGPEHTNLHKVQAFECFANGGIMDYGQWYLDRYSPGTDKSAGYVNGFIKKVAPHASGRDYAADIGLVYCPWTLYATINVEAPVADLFLNEYKGWTDYLCNDHRQWDIVLGQDIESGPLDEFKVIVLPSILSLSDGQARALQRYVDKGGHLVVTGLSGTRFGPDQFLTSRSKNALAELKRHRRVHGTDVQPGAAYMAGEKREAAAQALAGLLAFEGLGSGLSTDAPPSVEVNLWKSARGPGYMLDLVNNDLDLESDRMTAAPACQVTMKLRSGRSTSKISRVQIITADADGVSETADLPAPAWQFSAQTGDLVVRLPSFRYYAMVFIE